MRPFWILAGALVAVWLLVALGTYSGTPGPTTHPAPTSYVQPLVTSTTPNPSPDLFGRERTLQAWEAAQTAAYLQAVSNAEALSASTTPSPAPVTTTSPAAEPVGQSGDGWAAVATCEEGGNNDPTMGYYGIPPSSWAGFDGYSTAGQAPMDIQQEWGAAHGGPPTWPGEPSCADYRGW